MNRYDDKYDYMRASVDNTDEIMTFIDKEWKKDHILAKDKEFFLWQYGREEYGDKKNLNIILMRSKEGELLGMIGYVAYSDQVGDLYISPAITKVKNVELLPMAGVEFMKRQMRIVGERFQLSSGTNPRTLLPIYNRVFHYRTGVMQQYYIVNPSKKEFRIAVVPSNKPRRVTDSGFRLEEFTLLSEAEPNFDFEKRFERMTVKSKEFINKRYFEHPIYKYKKWFVQDNYGETLAILFGRIVSVNGEKALRLVDYRGDLQNLPKIGYALTKMIEEEGYEYADLMVDQLSQSKMEEGGFRLLDINGKTVIPNYFEPFVRENISIHYENNSDAVLFKADGDQDRPNYR